MQKNAPSEGLFNEKAHLYSINIHSRTCPFPSIHHL
jgi:hypothetical protein